MFFQRSHIAADVGLPNAYVTRCGRKASGLDGTGRRPVFGGCDLLQTDPAWRDLIPFHEYFHADTGAGLGASHQTGWTGLVANLIVRRG